MGGDLIQTVKAFQKLSQLTNWIFANKVMYFWEKIPSLD